MTVHLVLKQTNKNESDSLRLRQWNMDAFAAVKKLIKGTPDNFQVNAVI